MLAARRHRSPRSRVYLRRSGAASSGVRVMLARPGPARRLRQRGATLAGQVHPLVLERSTSRVVRLAAARAIKWANYDGNGTHLTLFARAAARPQTGTLRAAVVRHAIVAIPQSELVVGVARPRAAPGARRRDRARRVVRRLVLHLALDLRAAGAHHAGVTADGARRLRRAHPDPAARTRSAACRRRSTQMATRGQHARSG